MNNNPEYASNWKGRLLLQYYAEDTKHPEMKIEDISNSVKQDAAKWVTQTEYELMVEIGTGICLPDSKKYKIRIAINDFVLQTDGSMHDKEENYCRWNKRFDLQTIKTVYPSVEEMGRIYVYLLDGSNPICFWKGNIADF